MRRMRGGPRGLARGSDIPRDDVIRLLDRIEDRADDVWGPESANRALIEILELIEAFASKNGIEGY